MPPFQLENLFVPIFVFLAILVVYRVGRGLFTWMDNNAQPVETLSARVVAKRTDTRSWNSRHRVSTDYFATFELASGERLEFDMDGETFGLLAEGDEGQLSHQGTRYHGFRRT